MMKEELFYTSVGEAIKDSVSGKLFGKPCYKIGTKAFVCFFKDCMVFKLNGEFHQNALALEGAELFDPSGNKRPMKEWVQVPYHHKEQWMLFAEASANYINSLKK